MFVNFFYELKRSGVPVSLTEWMTLMEALSKGLACSSLNSFYYLARAVLVKSEAYFDNYDQAFYNYFKDIETPVELVEQAVKWMENKKLIQLMNDEEEEPLMDRKTRKLHKELVKFKIHTKGDKENYASMAGAKGRQRWGASRQGALQSSRREYVLAVPRLAVQLLKWQATGLPGYRSDVIIGVRRFEAALRVLRQLTNRNDALKAS